MTLTFGDLHGVEKGARCPGTYDGWTAAGDDPQIGDLGYWAPDANLVLYYGDVGYWTGIMASGISTGTCRPWPSVRRLRRDHRTRSVEPPRARRLDDDDRRPRRQTMKQILTTAALVAAALH